MGNFTTSQKVLMGILIIMLGYLMYDIWFGGNQDQPIQSGTRAVVQSQRNAGQGSSGNTAGTAGGTPTPANLASLSNNWFKNFSHDNWEDDPFRHPSRALPQSQGNSQSQQPVSQVLSSRFHLTAISKRGGDDYVLINNEVLAVGDMVDGAELVEIRTNSVVMDYRGNNIIVPLSSPQNNNLN
ncbi:MAG: general secretion pathway protein GspB [Candidatus Marinimicrobia bacterium]|nr:general secretion pathway protein GspB [Candidatus Neomarinimicrobiota bacterium]MCF7830179.1 general secretion pathway protein GspB [Candidatus Neomarinimicrobiota bacterium]MCF7882087.1 general secretion pathway protein GspB [Candidatus Neomarinimicrobiota bacterium]